MKTLDGILYRFRGYILGALAIALCIMPARQIEIACAPDAPTTTAFILCLAGILLRIRTRQFIGEHTRGSSHAADILVKAGPYACTRHPLYISNTLVALSAILFHLGIVPEAVPFALAVVAFEIFLAHAENRFLEGKFGDEWREWKPGPIAALRKRHDAPTEPKRTFFRAFCADWATWTWLLLYYLLLLAKKVFMS
jgi:protein-S-isoprenylcysteine O-methyltransferase Ste14